MRKIVFLFALICTALIISGCSNNPDAKINNANKDSTTDATTPKTTDTNAPTTDTASTPIVPPKEIGPATPSAAPTTTFSVADCNLLEPKDFEPIFGESFKEASKYAYPGGTCSRGWGDAQLFRSGRGASVALNMNNVGDPNAIKGDLDLSCLESVTIGTSVINNPVGFQNVEAVTGLGDYLACWFKAPYDAVNFGKGKYKFQLQCTGGACDKDKAVALAKLVVSRVS